MTAATHQRTALLSQLLTAAVEANPTGVAVVDGDTKLSYLNLDKRSSRLARALIARGVGPESFVAVGLTRSVRSIVTVWAVAKTGAAFVPMDPRLPAERVAHMVSDSGVTLGVTTTEFAAQLPQTVPWLVLDDDGFAAELKTHSPAPVSLYDRTGPVRAANSAYVIYTSGSTGLPKGVVVTNAGLLNLAEEQRSRYGLTAASRTLHFSSPVFDASVLELLMAAPVGATMVIAPPTVYGGVELAALLAEHRVTTRS